jgi:plastocyanin
MNHKPNGKSRLHSFIASLIVFAAWQSQANIVEVDWTSSGFSTTHITINPGDEVDIVNYDFYFALRVTGASPESFYSNIPASDGEYVYYFPHVYNNPGSFSFSDQYGDTVSVGVNSAVPLSVAITAPANNAALSAPATFTVTAVPSGGTPPYIFMDFYVGTNPVGFAYDSPFSTTITNLLVGNYNISAVVTDNFLNTATNSILVHVIAPTPPRLTATHAGNQFIISWPTNNSSGLSLKGSASLGSGASWSAAGSTPVLVGNQWVVTNSISGTAQFFRLSNH